MNRTIMFAAIITLTTLFSAPALAGEPNESMDIISLQKAVAGALTPALLAPSAVLLVPQGALAEYEGLESYRGPAEELGDLGSSGEPAEYE